MLPSSNFNLSIQIMILFRTITGNPLTRFGIKILQSSLAAGLLFSGSGCASFSKSVAGIFPKPSAAKPAYEPMRVSVASATFKPLQPLRIPRYSGLETPLAHYRQLDDGRTSTRLLPRLTPLKVLKTNNLYALVELQSGERGFIAVSDMASEASLFSATAALKPLPANGPIDPATGLPYNQPPPEMTTVDPLIDQALLNNVDTIKLPESEASFNTETPQGQVVDGVLLRKPGASTSPETPANPAGTASPTP